MRKRLWLVLLIVTLFCVNYAYARGGKEAAGEGSGQGASTTTAVSGKTSPGQYIELAAYEKLLGKPLTFNEAPALKDKVATGKLPPLRERLPEEPLVVTPISSTGTYGGILNSYLVSADMWNPPAMFGYEPMLMLDRSMSKIIPNIAKAFEFSTDLKTFTLHLRKGMKWSDGEPFTTEDILFWWQDIILNEQLTPVKPANWMAGGKLMKVKKVDDQTVQFQFAVPNPNIDTKFSVVGEMGYQSYCFAPAHALKKYHIKYNPDAEKLAKDAGYDHWWELFTFKNTYSPLKRTAGIPTLDPWIVDSQTAVGVTFVRNPYYWKVDTAGNQLPYIDGIRAPFITDPEVRITKMISGELEFDPGEIDPDRFPFLKENEKKGNYTVWNVPDVGLSSVAFYAINQNYYDEDPVLGKMLLDKRFRQALSLGINRKEINDLYFFGKGRASQVTAYSTASFYDDKWAQSYAEYNPARANAILDEMGLKKGPDGMRLRPDGQRLGLRILVLAQVIPVWEKITELTISYWGALGIKVDVKPSDYGYLIQQVQSGKHQVALWVMDGMTEFQVISTAAGRFGVQAAEEPNWWAPKWAEWWKSKDSAQRSGSEPPPDIKELFSMAEKLPDASKAEVANIAKSLFTLHAEQLYMIGTVGYLVGPRVASNKIKNVEILKDYTGNAIGGSRFLLAEQIYLAAQ